MWTTKDYNQKPGLLQAGLDSWFGDKTQVLSEEKKKKKEIYS